MEVNKVVYNGDTLLDLTSDTVTPQTLVKGATAHNKSGTNITGTADYAISSTSTTSPITDSADGMVQGVTIYGRSEVVEGEIKSVGEGYAVVDLGTLTWNYDTTYHLFYTSLVSAPLIPSAKGLPCLCSKYRCVYSDTWWDWKDFPNNSISCSCSYSTANYHNLVIKDTDYTNATDFKAAMSGVMLVYELADPTQGNTLAVKTDNGTGIDGTMATFTTALPLRSTLDGTTRDELIIGNGKAEVITRCEVVDDSIVPLAEPITTPLTSAEISAFRSLRTYDSTTNITITDEPEFEIDYLKNTDNGQTVADIQTDLQGQINGLAIKTLTYTGTGTTTNSITFPEKPLMVLGITQHEMESPYQDYHRSIIPFVYDSRSSTMLVQWVKNVDTSSTQYRGSMLYYLTINGNTMTWTAQDASQAFNLENIEYTVYYI